MMRVVEFLHEIGHRQLQLMQPQTTGLVARGEPQTWPQI